MFDNDVGKTTKEEWSRFQEPYAQEVTDVDVDVVLLPDSLKSLIKVMTIYGSLLCPTLFSMHVNPRCEEGGVDLWTSLVDLLAGPTMKRVELARGSSTIADMNRIIYTVVARSPGIQSVTVYTPAFSPDYLAFINMKRLVISGWLDHGAWNLGPCKLPTPPNCRTLGRAGGRRYV